MSTPTECPAGFYCPIGSEKATACPEGTYNNYTKEFSNSSCKNCPPGKYCNPTAQTYPTGKFILNEEMIFLFICLVVRVMDTFVETFHTSLETFYIEIPLEIL
jgi:hypothetical protein